MQGSYVGVFGLPGFVSSEEALDLLGAFVFTVALGSRALHARRQFLPHLAVRFAGEVAHPNYLVDRNLTISPIFDAFDRKYFFDHLLPDGPIKFRGVDQFVSGAELKFMCEGLVIELQEGRKKLSDFKVMKARGYNHRLRAGLIIVEFKDYPFVLKLSIETPQSFVRPYAKGFVEACVHVLSRGANRHLLGFSRVRVAEELGKIINSSDKWVRNFDVPRKWFWLPEDDKWLDINGFNMTDSREQTVIPAIYGVICDKIECVKRNNFKIRGMHHHILKFSNEIDDLVDTHTPNCAIEKNSGKVVFIDTEHFAKLVGLEKGLGARNYGDWYLKLAMKYVNAWGRSFSWRNRLQR